MLIYANLILRLFHDVSAFLLDVHGTFIASQGVAWVELV